LKRRKEGTRVGVGLGDVFVLWGIGERYTGVLEGCGRKQVGERGMRITDLVFDWGRAVLLL